MNQIIFQRCRYKPSLLSKPNLISEMSKRALPWRMTIFDSVTHNGCPCIAPSVTIEPLEAEAIAIDNQYLLDYISKYVRLTKYVKVVIAYFFAVLDNLYFKFRIWKKLKEFHLTSCLKPSCDRVVSHLNSLWLPCKLDCLT